MKTIEQLYNGFYLDKECSNSQISNCPNPLRVAPIKKSNSYKKLEIEKNKFTFAEKDENGRTEYFCGLKNFLWIKKLDFSPIFIFDNHNHSPIFRYYCIKESKLNSPILVHIDQHSDCRKNENHLKLNWNDNELEKVFGFYNQKCNVGNFISPTIESGIIWTQIQVRSNTALKNLEIKKNQNFILDIDLDFCLNGINRNKTNEESLKLLKKKFNEFGKNALCITIATSPYFLDQKEAINMTNYLLNNY